MNRVKIPRNLVGSEITSSKESFLEDSDYELPEDSKFKVGDKVIYGWENVWDKEGKKLSGKVIDIFKMKDEEEIYLTYQIGYLTFLEEDLELDEDENDILKRLVNG